MAASETSRDRAHKVLDTWRNGDSVHIVGCESFIEIESAVRKLADAGLLRTGIEERAVAACREYAMEHQNTDPDTLMVFACNTIKVGREILAAETPKPPKWIAQRVLNSQMWNVGKPDCLDGSVGSATFVLTFTSERDARVVANAFNAVDEWQ